MVFGLLGTMVDKMNFRRELVFEMVNFVNYLENCGLIFIDLM